MKRQSFACSLMIVGDLIQITGFCPRGHAEPKQGVDYGAL